VQEKSEKVCRKRMRRSGGRGWKNKVKRKTEKNKTVGVKEEGDYEWRKMVSISEERGRVRVKKEGEKE
jgi:hypothetical protein